MNPVEAGFSELSAEPVTRAVPLSHVSVELGHLYPEDLQVGPDRLRAMFHDAAPWAAAALQGAAGPGRRTRASTCFLVDDYFGRIPGPDQVVPQLLAAAGEAGLRIDYLAREAACAGIERPDGALSPARLVLAQLVDEPPVGSLGVRPPAAESGWLCNGVRSAPASPPEAMAPPSPWVPPRQNAARRHSIFVDVQLWDDDGGERTWSCPMLAATWQLLRLGLLRNQGEPVLEPADPPPDWPRSWAELPAVTRLSPTADPFCAYTTVSVLSPRFLPVELAVRTVLSQFQPEPAVIEQVDRRAGTEGLGLPLELVDRVGYAFAGRSEVDPA